MTDTDAPAPGPSAPDGDEPRELIYITDPMCSWCYGFSPVVAQLREAYGERTPLRVLLGGLFPGTDRPLDDAGKATVREHWDHVAEATGQEFDHGFFDREGFVYDTEPPCRAVVVVRALRPGAEFDYLRRVHAAFYGQNVDVTDGAVLASLAEPFGFSAEEFTAAFESQEARKATWQDFQTARHLGISSFPTLLAREGSQATLLTMGYRPYAEIEQALTVWLGEARVH